MTPDSAIAALYTLLALYGATIAAVALFASGMAIDDIRQHPRNPRRRSP